MKYFLFFCQVIFITSFYGQNKTNKLGHKVGRWEIRDTVDGVAYRNVCNFKNGKIHGQYISYFSNDEIASITNFENGLKNGVAKFYYQNKSISDVYYFIDNKTKYHVTYKPDGQIFQENYDKKFYNYHNGRVVDTLILGND